MKYLIWLVIVLAVVVWVQRAKKMMAAARDPLAGARRGDGARAANGANGAGRQEQQAEVMVQCAHCGVHFPASESIVDSAGVVFCSVEHRRLAAS